MSKQAVNDDLRHLEARGYPAARRTPHPDDGRARVVRLTERGRALQDAVHAAGRQVEREWEEEIGEPEGNAFSRVLDRLAQAALHLDREVERRSLKRTTMRRAGRVGASGSARTARRAMRRRRGPPAP